MITNRKNPSERVTHITFACFYVDGYSYQENLLPRFHQRAGHHVTIITSPVTYDEHGAVTHTVAPSQYNNEDGISVQRLRYSKLPFSERLRIHKGTYRALAATHPDVVFIHGPQFVDAITVALYLKLHPNTRAYVDNHADFGNSATSPVSRWLLHGVIWRSMAKLLERRVRKMYGVLPARVDFLCDVYGIARSKTSLLLMGADNDLVDNSRARTKESIRAEYGLPVDSFIVATGGKVNAYRPEVLELLESVQQEDATYEVAIFGNASSELRPRYEELCESKRVHHLGWLDNQQTLDIMRCADLVCFPGKHSVLWEQAVAVGAPLLIRSLPGTGHVDLDGNCQYLNNADAHEIQDAIGGLVNQPKTLDHMKQRAESTAREEFLYAKIADTSIAY